MSRARLLILSAAAVALAVVGVALALRLFSVDSSRDKTKLAGAISEKPLASARTILKRATDLDSCRSALQLLNAHLSGEGSTQPPALDTGRRDELAAQFGIDKEELDELANRRFTLLDGHHLDFAFLLRDAAQSLEIRSREGKRLPPQVEAEAAFAWVMRMVQRNDSQKETTGDKEWLAPEFALRLGAGSALMRAVIFLGLLEQLGHDGCLLSFPDSPGPRYWACGVLGDDGRIYLFDPRMGIPLPGPKGGTATLADLQQADSSVLRQLHFDKDMHYDVTPEQAARAEVHLTPALSALAPRMKFLEQELLAPAVKVRLAADPARAGRFAKALKAAGHKNATVKLAPWAARLQRGYFPREEGGIDKTNRKRETFQQIAKDNVPFLYRALPPSVRPKEVGQWSDKPLVWIFSRYMEPFVDFTLKAGQPRDRVLRGRLDEAASELGTSQDRFQEQRQRFKAVYDPGVIEQWFEEASAVAAKGRERADGVELNKRFGKPLLILVEGSAAEPRLRQVVYLRALCKQEQAARLQFRLDHFPAQATREDYDRADGFWKEARYLWEGYLNEHAGADEFARVLESARVFRAQAQQQLSQVKAYKAAHATERGSLQEDADDARRTAADYWQNLARDRKDVQGLAYRFQAERLRKK